MSTRASLCELKKYLEEEEEEDDEEEEEEEEEGVCLRLWLNISPLAAQPARHAQVYQSARQAVSTRSART